MNGVRVRIAPSPTGHLHIGNLRSMLFNWLFARHHKGTFLVRVEDTDTLRSKPEYVTSILRSMEWMGLVPDEPPVYQMSRVHEHQAAALELMEKGYAYPCFCEPKDAEKVIYDLEQGHGSRYDRTCRDKKYTPEDLKRPHAIRFRMPDDVTAVTFDDAVVGRVTVEADHLDDFVIMRRDGTPIYNFCVVVDDIFMRISHVIRGQDHISNTSKQVLLYKALGFQLPQFAHIPLILGPHGGKLSKRDASVSVEEYRAQGFLPEALFNYLVRLGWSHGDQELFTKEEMISYFSLDHVGKKGAVFDIKKLLWVNGCYLRNATAERLLQALDDIESNMGERLHSLWGREKLIFLIDQYKQRASTLLEIAHGISTLAHDVVTYDVSVLDKWRTAKTKLLLSRFIEKVLPIVRPEQDQLLEIAKIICDQEQEKLVNLAQPIRLALTGGVTSPGVFELFTVVGKEKAIGRIERLLKQL